MNNSSTEIFLDMPNFFINLDNPTEISYTIREGNWKCIQSSTYAHGFPEIKENQILYVYKYCDTSFFYRGRMSRGYIHNLDNIGDES